MAQWNLPWNSHCPQKLSTNTDEYNMLNLSVVNINKTQMSQPVQTGEHKATDTVTLLNGVTD